MVGEIKLDVSDIEVVFFISEVICTGKDVTFPVEIKFNVIEVRIISAIIKFSLQ